MWARGKIQTNAPNSMDEKEETISTNNAAEPDRARGQDRPRTRTTLPMVISACF